MHGLSSHAFPSLYLWQTEMDLLILLEKDFFTVKFGMKGDNTWFFPCGAQNKIYDFIAGRMDAPLFSLHYLRTCDVVWIERNFPDQWNFRRAPESDEYICDIAEYIALQGSKFAEIRRKIRKLDKSYTITIQTIGKANMEDAMGVVSQWKQATHPIGEHGLTGEEIAEQALLERTLLDVTGIILYMDDIPVSVFAGFPLSRDTLDIVIGKCIPDAPKGTAYYALRECFKQCGGTYTYCNHEEDLGIEGIHRMKASFYPISKTPIWEATLKW